MPSAGLRVDPYDEEPTPYVELTAEQALAFRNANPAWSPGRVVLAQLVSGFVLAATVGLVSDWAVAKSLLAGVLSVALPAALFAKGMSGSFGRGGPGAAVASFLLWELVKIVATVAMLVSANFLLVDLNWLALLAGLVVALKVYWLALFFRPKPRQL